MKKTVLKFGLISGLVSVLLMLATIPFMNTDEYWKSDVIGYTAIVLGALLVFFGIRSYRENAGRGRLTFGRGLAVGVLITLVSCTCYTLVWEILYYKVMPGLGDRVAACMVARAKASGDAPDKIEASIRQVESFHRLYDRPLMNVALTFAEPFPVGVIVAAVASAILRRKNENPG